MFKEYFIDKEGTSTKKCLIDCMCFSAEEFEPNMKKLIEEDTFIN